MLNVSQSVMSGQLAILAAAQGPVPMPLEVDGDKVTGKGWTFYQFILPIDRGSLDGPPTTTTQPVSGGSGMAEGK